MLGGREEQARLDRVAEQCQQDEPEPEAEPNGAYRPVPAEVEPRRDGEQRRDRDADRGRDDEAGVRVIEEHARRGQRVQAEEAGGSEEAERDEEHPGVAAALAWKGRKNSRNGQ